MPGSGSTACFASRVTALVCRRFTFDPPATDERRPAFKRTSGLSQKDSDVAMPPEREDLYSALLRARHRNQSIETCVVLQMRRPADRCARGSSASRNMCTTAQRVACQLESSGIFRGPMKMQK